MDGSDYEREVPRFGAIPFNPPQPKPKGVVGRSRHALRRYRGLRQRARADSMSWWWMKFLHGLLVGGGPFAIGLLMLLVNAVLNVGSLMAWAGGIIFLVGLFIILRYALAPYTCQWVVTVPEDRFCFVEDADGNTAEFLEPGRWIVNWRWYGKVRDYVNFKRITANVTIADVLGGGGPVMDMEVTVIMAFNPTQAEEYTYAQLRRLVKPEHFEDMISQDVRSIVRKHIRLLNAEQQRSAVRNTRALEEVIADQLDSFRLMGLTLASSRPVMVYVRNAPAAPGPMAPQAGYNAWPQNQPPAPSQGYYQPPYQQPPPAPPPQNVPPAPNSSATSAYQEPPPGQQETRLHPNYPTIERRATPPPPQQQIEPHSAPPPPQQQIEPSPDRQPPEEDVPEVKKLKNRQDPLKLRRDRHRRRSRDQDEEEGER
jgi:hypothetical protein